METFSHSFHLGPLFMRRLYLCGALPTYLSPTIAPSTTPRIAPNTAPTSPLIIPPIIIPIIIPIIVPVTILINSASLIVSVYTRVVAALDERTLE